MPETPTLPPVAVMAAPPPAQAPRPRAFLRTVGALMLREMSTTYGRSAFGYLWAVLEPVAGIMLLTFVFTLALRSPALGTNFPLFYASGLVPFLAYMDVQAKLTQSMRFSRQLLFYPRVTFADALIARLLMTVITQTMVGILVIGGIIWVYDLQVLFDVPRALRTYGMVFALGAGIGTFNCYLVSIYPGWERAWAVLNRPLLLISCIFFTYDSVPKPYSEYLWWNPLVHVVGQMRSAIYATYDAAYVTPLYIYTISGLTLTAGLLLLRRYHRDIMHL